MANNKRYYHRNNKNKGVKQQVDTSVVVEQYSSEQLSRTIAELGISDSVCELLAKNRIETAADLVVRTEKDMYRVQGFGKKMLFEIKEALRAVDMELRKEEPKSKPNNAAQKQNALKQQQGAQGIQEEEARSSKFGLADRKAESKQKQQQPVSKQQAVQKQAQPQPKQQPVQKQQQARTPSSKPEKLTSPLPIESWRKVMKGGKWGYSDGFKIVIPTMYDEVFCFKEGLASVEIDGKCGYIDDKNNVVIPFEYDTAMSFSEGYAMVVKGDKCGYINKNNEVVIPFVYAAATPFEGGEAKVKKDGKWATLTPDGKLVWI